MIRRAQDMQTVVREQMRGGEGNVLLTHLEKAMLPESARLFARLTLAPGCSIGEHVHEGEAELFYFVQGEGTVTDDGVEVPVRAGDSMLTPSGHGHSVINTGGEDLVLLAVIVKG